MTKSTSAVARGQRGQARLRQIARESEAEREAEATRLLTGLGHEPSAVEMLVIEQLSARVVMGRRLRRQGKDDSDQARLIAQLLRSIGLKPAAVAPPDPTAALEAIFEEIAAEKESAQ
jgi:hypothetical protein